MLYYSTFVPGFQDFIKILLKEKIRDISIEQMFSGGILYETKQDVEKIKDLRFFDSSFAVIKVFKSITEEDRFDHIIKLVQNSTIKQDYIRSIIGSKTKKFRIVLSEGDKPATGTFGLLKDLEQKLLSYDRLHLILQRQKGNCEFWILRRPENIAFFMVKLTNKDPYADLSKGDITPELANLMCEISKPGERDIFLDPFAGYGSILIERSLMGPCKLLFANDINTQNTTNITKKAKQYRIKKNIICKNQDSLNINFFKDGFITKIVTAPAKATSDKTDTQVFFEKMLKEFSRLLYKNGIAVVLTTSKLELLKAIEKTDIFDIEQSHNIEFLGQKTVIFRLMFKKSPLK